MKSQATVVDIYHNENFITSVPVVDGHWQHEISALSVGPHSFQAKIKEQSSNVSSLIVVYPSLRDLTDFNNGSWNGWARGAGGGGLFIKDGNHLFNWTDRATVNVGIALTKTLNGFNVGGQYRFQITAWRGVDGAVSPVLSLREGNNQLGNTETLTTSGRIISRTFVASSPSMTFHIYSHRGDTDGNDYGIDNIRIESVEP